MQLVTAIAHLKKTLVQESRIGTKLDFTILRWVHISYLLRCYPILQCAAQVYEEFVNCERNHSLVMKPPLLPFQSLQPQLSLLLSFILQLIGSVDSADIPPMPSVTPLLNDALRKDIPIKPLLSLARSAAELTCDHRLYQVMWNFLLSRRSK